MLSCSFQVTRSESLGLERGRWRVGHGTDEIRVFVEDVGSGTRVRFEQGEGPVGIPFSRVDDLAKLVGCARDLIEATTKGTVLLAGDRGLETGATGEGGEELEAGFSLDREKLSVLRDETAKVAAFLAQVFQDEVEEIVEEEAVVGLSGVPQGPGPDLGTAKEVPHRAWVRALADGPSLVAWPEFEASAREHGITFVDAAIEEINDYVLEAGYDWGLSGSEVVEVNSETLEGVL